ncbi:MAG: SGNH/GDSL hydrolase family protein [Polyangiales bacterium]
MTRWLLVCTLVGGATAAGCTMGRDGDSAQSTEDDDLLASGSAAAMAEAAVAEQPDSGSASDAGSATSCEKGKVKATEVVFIGESFIAQSGAIPRMMTDHARAAGTIGATESYRSFAVSGTQLANGQIPSQYARAKAQSPVKVVLMDGGGNDLLWGGLCKDGPASCRKILETVEALFAQMARDGVTDVVYFFYPDPVGIGAAIKPAMDILRPQMKELCAQATDLRCTWVDQRESWNGNYDKFTSDGIHPTAAGARASSKQIWEAMVARCVAQ